LPRIPGEFGVPEAHHMRERTPDAEGFGTERIAMHNNGWDMEQGAVNVSHMYRKEIDIDCGHMQLLLIVDSLLSECLGQGNDHGAAADTRFVCPDKFLLRDQALCIMHEHFGHGETHWEVHDFPDKELGKVIPYGVYDMATNTGWVSVGVDHDTAEFAVETIRRWWHHMGSTVYPRAQRLLITADGGGSNGSRNRLWKMELQKLADDIRLRIVVCHFPPGTSKWNKIEHRMFCHITENWRGRPLVSREVVVNLIGHTTTRTGLEIHSELNENSYPTGREVTDQQMESLAIKRDKFHGEWNYTLVPRA